MNDSIEASITCIAYNHAKFIRKTLDGFLMQKVNFAYEIIVHDDASTDDTPKILLEYQKKYPNIIRLILQKENQYSQGIDPDFTYIVPQVRGKYIAMCEGDDAWTYEGKLQAQYDLMEANPDISLCVHNAIQHNMATGEDHILIKDLEDGPISDKDLFLGKSGRPTASFFYRSKYLHEIPKFIVEAPVGDDPWEQYLGYKGKVYYINQVWSVWNYMHEESWNYRMNRDWEVRKEYASGYMDYLINLKEYTGERFEALLPRKMEWVCKWILERFAAEGIKQRELKEVVEDIVRRTKHSVSNIWEKAYFNFVEFCTDYIPEDVCSFLEKMKKNKGNLYLYGAGEQAGLGAERLGENKISFSGFVVSNGCKEREIYMEHNVYELSFLKGKEEESFIWVCLNKQNAEKVLPLLKKEGFLNIVFSSKQLRRGK